jgi:hypothetical protein
MLVKYEMKRNTIDVKMTLERLASWIKIKLEKNIDNQINGTNDLGLLFKQNLTNLPKKNAITGRSTKPRNEKLAKSSPIIVGAAEIF